MGKAAAKKRRSKSTKTAKKLVAKGRDEESMVVDQGASGDSGEPLTGRQKHAEAVRAKRALRKEKEEILWARLAMPKRTRDRRDERKALTVALKDLKRQPAAGDAEAAGDPDAAMDDGAAPKFAYQMNDKRAKHAARKRAKQRASG